MHEFVELNATRKCMYFNDRDLKQSCQHDTYLCFSGIFFNSVEELKALGDKVELKTLKNALF